MNVDLILNIIREKNSFLSKIIDHVKIEYIDDFKARFSGVSDTIAFFDAVNFIVYYGDGLCKDYSVDEQAFIIAHEIMHYCVSINVNRKQFHNCDGELLNFVEDAQINQLLLAGGFIPPKGVVLISDALDYGYIELYNILYPHSGEIKHPNENFDWTKNVTLSELLKKSLVSEKTPPKL